MDNYNRDFRAFNTTYSYSSRNLQKVNTVAPNPVNRFIYVKQNFVPPPSGLNEVRATSGEAKIAKGNTVLINPKFSKRVFINPLIYTTSRLQPPVGDCSKTSKGSNVIHVNPKVLLSLQNSKVESKVVTLPPPPPPPPKAKAVISTRTKLVRVPTTTPGEPMRTRRSSLVSINSKYKIVRSSRSNKLKLDNQRRSNGDNNNSRRKYVFVNRFLSMSVAAKNLILKQQSPKKRGFVNINGILYKKSPNSLRKASESTLALENFATGPSHRSLSNITTRSRFKIIRKSGRTNTTASNTPRSARRVRLISSSTPSRINKMRKCNIPCPMYRKYGKCRARDIGKCIKLHNPDQIILCTRFLQGACRDLKCPLSHKVSDEKMPTCKYFLEGLCSRDDCPYLHVRISPKADICRDFVQGFCARGAQCDKRHQFLCPDFEKNKRCPTKRCRYPHRIVTTGQNVVRKSKVTNSNNNSKGKIVVNNKRVARKREVVVEQVAEDVDAKRYYVSTDNECVKGDVDVDCGERVFDNLRTRPRLGELPAFIPFSEDL